MNRVTFVLALLAVFTAKAIGQSDITNPATADSDAFAELLPSIDRAASTDEGLTMPTVLPSGIVILKDEVAPLTDSVTDSDVAQTSHLSTGHHIAAPVPGCGHRCRGLCRERYTQFLGSIDYLYWKARRGGLDFGILDPNNDNNIEGPVEALSLESASGVRANIGARIACNWDLGFTYTSFQTDDRRSLEAGTGQLWLTRTNPGSFNNFATTAEAEAELDYQVFDIQAGYWFHPNDIASVRVFAGPRGADIEQAFDLTYSGGNVTGTRIQQQSTRLTGFGLRAGGEAHWRLGSALSLFGSAAGSVLVGELELEYLEQEAALSSGNVATRVDSFETVPVLDVAAGINLTFGKLSFQTGYELSNWFNVDQRLNFTGSSTIMRGSLTPSAQDLLVDGLFVRMAYNY